ncbi:RNA polymerase sigma factor [Lysobacter enzymogenes]|uniref:RNA polymerase sigma factor n=1 Tax=Lysobacter enzymogenes TaxID=69 RepID=UPI001A970392|nr:RNA polymerase sigma factor [Lysobacter enzymogenes]QQP96294.1 RNA polymerase sigma factor [Lysobacter enzymogenes]
MNADALHSLIGHDLPLASRGDTAAYSRIVGACQNSITAIALAMVRDVQASEDIAQEAFLSAWQNIRALHNPASFLPWLRQITRNLARDHLRGRGRQPREAEDAELAIELAADPAPGAIERLLDAERARVAAELISALPDESREALLLYYREGQSSQQVAALLGLSDAAVRKRLSRARGAVREELMQRFAVFARASAPSVGFTTAVASALGLLAPPSIATAALVGGAAGSGLAGKLGLGAASASGGAAGGGALALLQQAAAPAAAHPLGQGMQATLYAFARGADIGAIAGGVAGGAIVGYAMTRYLFAYAADREERRRIVSMMVWLFATAAASCLGLLAVMTASRGWLAPGAFTVLFAAFSTWQALVWMPRRLEPMFARIRRQTGRDPRQAPRYRWLLGPQAMVWSNVLLLSMMAMVLYRDGRFG